MNKNISPGEAHEHIDVFADPKPAPLLLIVSVKRVQAGLQVRAVTTAGSVTVTSDHWVRELPAVSSPTPSVVDLLGHGE